MGIGINSKVVSFGKAKPIRNPSETHPFNDNHQLLRDSFGKIPLALHPPKDFSVSPVVFWSEFHSQGLTQEQMVALREKYDLDGDQTLTLVPSFEEMDLHETGGGGFFYNEGGFLSAELHLRVVVK